MLKTPHVSWASLYYQFMSWSYVGLISAFGAELSVRLPNKPFWAMVGISSVAICAIGGVNFLNLKNYFTKEGNLIA